MTVGKRTVTKTHIERERSSTKLKEAMMEKGYPSGRAPAGKEIHHKIPVALGGKTTPKNLQVVSPSKHQEIHRLRRQQGKKI